MSKVSFIDRVRSYILNRQDGYTGFVRVKIQNLTSPGVKEVKVHFREIHEIDERNMVDISGKVPVIHNYTKEVRVLEGKQTEIYDPIQLKFMALWCAKDWTIHTIREKLGYSYRQARYIKQYQNNMLARDSQNTALLFLESHFV